MKSLFVVSREPGAGNAVAERRRSQRRMAIPRRIIDRRTGNGRGEAAGERRGAPDRRGSTTRRRTPDRRIGLSPDLDLYLLGI